MNFDILPQGGVSRRNGTRFIAEAMSNTGNVKLFPFAPSVTEPYVIEMDDTNLRVILEDQIVDLDGGGTFTIAHGFTDIESVKSAQSNDVTWFVGGGAAHRLLRRGLNDWALEPMEFLDGPFDTQNFEKTETIQASATSGNITLTATGFTFQPEIVGSVIRLAEENLEDIPIWQADRAIAVGELVRSADSVYRCTVAQADDSKAKQQPTHLIGEVQGASGQSTFLYLHSGYGLVEITGFTNATTLQGRVISARPYEDTPDPYLPDDVVNNGSSIWALPMFFDGSAPSAVTFYQERLALSQGNRLFLSRSGNFASFREGTLPDDAISLEATSNQFNQIYALTEINGFLMAIGQGGIQRFSSSSGGAIAPDDIFQRKVKRQVMKDLQPLETDDSVFVFPDPAETVYEVAYLEEAGGFLSPDAAIMSDHMFKVHGEVVDAGVSRGVVQKCIFAAKAGMIVVLYFDKYQEFSGWARRWLGGPTLSVTSVMSKDGPLEYYVVKRNIGGVERRFIEYSKEITGQVFGVRPPLDPDNANYTGYDDTGLPLPFIGGGFDTRVSLHLDCAILYESGDTTLGHLEGETVEWARDSVCGTDVVTGGAITIPGARAWVGLPFKSRIKTLRLQLGQKGDGAMGERKQNISKLVVDVLHSAGLEAVGRDLNQYLLQEREDDFASGIELKTGFWDTPISSSWSDQGQIVIESNKPFPATIRSITPVVD